MEEENKTIDEGKALEIALILLMVDQIEKTLSNDNKATRSIAINEIRKGMKKNTALYLKNASVSIKNDIINANRIESKELAKKIGNNEPLKLPLFDRKYIKQSEDYFKKYVDTSKMRFGNSKTFTQYYTNFINANVKDIVEGKVTIEQATRKAIKEISESGIKIIEFTSGIKRNLDVVVRQQMEYASKESVQELREKFAKDNGITIWEFDAHPNARPSHQRWQGKRFDTTGKDYPTLDELTHGEENDFGCKHRKFPVWDKEDPYMFNNEQLKNIDTKPFEWNGKTYDGYQATQEARKMERNIRALKRHKKVLEGCNKTNDEEYIQLKAQLRNKNKQYKGFMQTFGTYPRTNRL